MLEQQEINISQVGIEFSDLLSQMHDISFDGLPEQSWSKDDFRKMLEITGTNAYVVDLHEQPIGFILVREAVDEAEIITFCILPKWCNNGYATLLLEWLIRKLQQRCFNRLFLEVRENNEAAIRVYKKCSFKIVGRRTGYYKNHNKGNIDALVMQVDIID